MNFRILIPFWGTNPAYVNLLDEWFRLYRLAHCPHPVTLISDFDTPVLHRYSWRSFPVNSRRDYIFDHKGEIVCAAVQAISDAVLVLDADAIVNFDPEPLLRPYEHTAFAMPADEACLGLHLRNRHAQETFIPKRCAGVLWFGRGGERSALVARYRMAFRDLESGRYYEERRLFEQHAWSMVAHEVGAPFLPRTLNWGDHIAHIGPNPEAAIYHRIGQRKFRLV